MFRFLRNPLRFLVPLAALVLIGACASPPATTPTTPTATPSPDRSTLDALLAEVKGMKKRAFDLKLFEILPDDWSAADSALTAGQASYDAKDYTAATENLGKAKSLFSDLTSKGIVARIAAKHGEADQAKASAEKAGTRDKVPDRVATADADYKAAAELEAAGKGEEAIAAWEKARLAWELAYKRGLASDLRAKIAGKDYGKWDSGNFATAEKKFEDEAGLWARGTADDRQAALDAIDEAILRYNLVIQKGRELAASDSKEGSDKIKAKADEIKAAVAVKDLYAEALAIYQDAVSLFAAKDYENAATRFAEAQTAFEKAYELAAEKRAAAIAAMEAATKATEAAGQTALDADPLVEQPKKP